MYSPSSRPSCLKLRTRCFYPAREIHYFARSTYEQNNYFVKCEKMKCCRNSCCCVLLNYHTYVQCTLYNTEKMIVCFLRLSVKDIHISKRESWSSYAYSNICCRNACYSAACCSILVLLYIVHQHIHWQKENCMFFKVVNKRHISKRAPWGHWKVSFLILLEFKSLKY